MDFRGGNLAMLVAGILGGIGFSALLVFAIMFYIRRKQKLKGYQVLKSDLLNVNVDTARRKSRAMSCFNILSTVQENGKAPAFSIPVTRSKTPPKRTCQLQCSLQYNFHTSILKIQVVCVVNLPRHFGLQSGVFVKVRILTIDDEKSVEDLGNTATQFHCKNPVFKDFFETKSISYQELKAMMLNLSLYSCDRFRQSHFVGDVSIKFADIHFSPLEPVMFWRPVQPKSDTAIPKINRSKGQLVLSLRYQKKTGRINVVVMKAINLVTPKRLLRTDPYVVVKLLFETDVVEKKQTQPCRGNLNPVWNEPFVFDWKNGSTTGYRFLFEIKSADMIFPDTTLGKVEICQDDSDHWKEMMNRKNYALAMCHEVE